MKWKIQGIEIKGFKSIAFANISLKDVNVVIGPNGAGKSNFLEVFKTLRLIAGRDANNLRLEAPGGIDKVLHLGTKHTDRIVLKLNGQSKTYVCTLTPEGKNHFKIFSEVLSGSNVKHELRISPDDHYLEKVGYPFNQQHEEVLGALKSFRVYQFNDTSQSSPIRTRSARVQDCHYLRDDGSNLAAFLYLLKRQYPDEYKEIKRVIRWIAPFFEDFLLEPEREDKDFIRLRWSHVGMQEDFDVAEFSDGTLRFICLIVALLQPEELLPVLIFFDEPELGLHPHAIELLVGLMQSVGARGVTKIVASTQSVPFANQFSFEDIIVVERVDNSAEFRRLTEKDTSAWLNDFAPGDAWMRNYFGGNP